MSHGRRLNFKNEQNSANIAALFFKTFQSFQNENVNIEQNLKTTSRQQLSYQMLSNWYSLANQISRNERLVDSKSRRCKWEDLPDRLPPSFASPFIRLKGGNITHANEEHEIRKGQRSGARTSMSRIFDETGETDSFFFRLDIPSLCVGWTKIDVWPNSFAFLPSKGQETIGAASDSKT